MANNLSSEVTEADVIKIVERNKSAYKHLMSMQYAREVTDLYKSLDSLLDKIDSSLRAKECWESWWDAHIDDNTVPHNMWFRTVDEDNILDALENALISLISGGHSKWRNTIIGIYDALYSSMILSLVKLNGPESVVDKKGYVDGFSAARKN